MAVDEASLSTSILVKVVDAAVNGIPSTTIGGEFDAPSDLELRIMMEDLTFYTLIITIWVATR